MTVEKLILQLEYLVKSNQLTGKEEVVLLGSGNKHPQLIEGGVFAPRISKMEIVDESNEGYYGLGFCNIEDITIK